MTAGGGGLLISLILDLSHNDIIVFIRKRHKAAFVRAAYQFLTYIYVYLIFVVIIVEIAD